MSVATVANSLRQLLNQANPAQIANLLQILAAGNLVGQMTARTLRRCNPVAAAANPYIVAGQSVAATTIALTQGQNGAPTGVGSTGAVSPAATAGANLLGQLPDDAKCEVILKATAIAGTGTLGQLVVDLAAVNDTNFATGGTGPAAGHVGYSPSGDIVTNATDAWTSIDVVYVPQKVDVFELPSIAPASAIVTLPPAFNSPLSNPSGQAAVTLMEAEILTGTVTGKCAILPPSASVPGATKQANLNALKTTVLFKVSDAPTLVRLKFGITSLVDQNQLLEQIASVF
jgi:hypothetical protein